jgi:hypothetical protein
MVVIKALLCWIWGFPPASASVLISLLFDPEYTSDMFLRNVRLSPIYTALQAQ